MFSEKFVRAGDRYSSLFDHVCAPMFRKSFSLDSVPERAFITVCGLGFYKLYINGTDITKGALAPYIYNPDHFTYYDRYEVSGYLLNGENVIGVVLGNGFFNPQGGIVWGFEKAKWRGPLRFALAFEHCESGREILDFEADSGFVCCDSPYLFDDLRMGVIYDAEKEKAGWNAPGYDDSGWKPALPAECPRGKAKLCGADAIKPGYSIAPVSVKFVESGYYLSGSNVFSASPVPESAYKNAFLYDFGENAAGVVQIRINAKRGQKITLRFGEFLFDGRFSQNTVSFRRSGEINRAYEEYNQRLVYICREGENCFVPDFTYFGFRYVLAEGLTPEQAERKDFITYIVMNSDIKKRAGFSCSDKIANKLYEAAIRSDLANFYYFPTDCPHREKNGWTGDASVSAEQIMLNFDAEKSFREWMGNVAKAQDESGVIPGIVPTQGWCYTGLRGPIWDSVCVNVPYYVYKYSGKKEILSECASMIFRYLDNIISNRNESGLVCYGLTDWCQPDKPNDKPTAPREVTDSLACYDIAVKAEKIFAVLGMDMRAEFASRLASSLRESIRKNLIDFSTMTVKGSCQTSQSVAIETGIFEPCEIESARKRLIQFVYEKDEHLDCGMFGLRYIFHALCHAGRGDLALKMITRTDHVSYGYWIENGATSLWESFCSMDGSHNSKNHHFFGDIISIFIQDFAGLQPNPYLNDITYFRVSPDFGCGLDEAEAYYESVLGKVSVKWVKEGDTVILEAEVPDGIKGQIELPGVYRFESGESICELRSGKYTVKK